MGNDFYSDFDWERLPARETVPYRTPFEIDRDRVIHTSAFRRLQAKTQVFLSGQYDIYRTRLTHSIEVGQIGRSISGYLKKTSPWFDHGFCVDPVLVEAVCLSHDLGHPPFGHKGERTLNNLMKPYGGFEGNAQTLRLLTETIYSHGSRRRGMGPTRALLDGILKYKSLYSERVHPHNHFLYDDQKPCLDFVLEGGDLSEACKTPREKNAFRSLECQIMDWADETAYCFHDLADGIRMGFITMDRLERWAEANDLDSEDARRMENLIETIGQGDIEPMLERKIGEFIRAASLVERSNFMAQKTNRYRFGLTIDPALQKECRLYKAISMDIVFQSERVGQLQYKVDRMLGGLFETLLESCEAGDQSSLRFLSTKLEKQFREVSERPQLARLICDYLAGMTDPFAIKTFRRLFDPGFTAIADIY